MKNLILSIALLLCSFLLLPNTANATCPDDDGGGLWSGPETAMVQVFGCFYEYTYCYRVNSITFFHEIALTEISIMPPCNGQNFEPNKQDIIDQILIEIAQGPIVAGLWDLEIPECPATLCLSRMYDAICYSGFYWDNNEGKHKMRVCDDGRIRSCNETVRICWEGNEQNIVVDRIGGRVGLPCPPPCRDTCQ